MSTSKDTQKIKKIYSVKDIKELSKHYIIENIKCFLENELNFKMHSKGQVIAWEETIILLKDIFKKDNPNWKIIFEFPIPMSSGKRPDLLLLNGINVFLIEFKNKSSYTLADVDQVKNYSLDLRFYHSSAKNFEIQPILLLLKDDFIQKDIDGINIIGKKRLKQLLVDQNKDYLFVNPDSLFDGDFKPIPSITDYAKSVFNNTEIKNIEIPEIKESFILHKEIKGIYENVIQNKEKAVVFINGEAGTGKTAIGLNVVYSLDGLYVTKNRQFQEHLTKELGNYSNIKTSHSFVKEFVNSSKDPSWDVVVFDEAQRFCPEYKMREYFNVDKTEQEVVLDFFKEKEWCLLVVLLGKGQEIGFGEYADLDNWRKAFNKVSQKWQVYGSDDSKIAIGYIQESNFITKNQLDLSKSFRNLRSSYYPNFINSLLDFEGSFNSVVFQLLQKEYQKLSNDGFKIYITRDFDKAVSYCEERFKDVPNSYCTLSSSQSYIDYDFCNERNNKTFKVGYEYSSKLDVNSYLKMNAYLEDENYYSLTEYSSIGFEVEIPIVIWGHDFIWYGNRWNYDFERKLKGGTQYRKNTYRIFLTRGRIGTILYFPSTWEFNNTFGLFSNLGATII
mgnify:CR=1 FL=1